MRSLVILCAAITLSACSAMMLGGGSTGASSTARNHPTSAMQPSDSALNDRVRAQYAADPMLANSAITVSTSAGLVTLTGKVPTYAARESAEKLAMATSGVKGVNNRITVNH